MVIAVIPIVTARQTALEMAIKIGNINFSLSFNAALVILLRNQFFYSKRAIKDISPAQAPFRTLIHCSEIQNDVTDRTNRIGDVATNPDFSRVCEIRERFVVLKSL